MAHIRAILRAKATHFSGQLQAQTMTILNDNFMYMESRARQIKRALEHTFPYIVATGLSKVIDSFKRTQFITYTAKPRYHNRHRGDRGRIAKSERYRYLAQDWPPERERTRLQAEVMPANDWFRVETIMKAFRCPYTPPIKVQARLSCQKLRRTSSPPPMYPEQNYMDAIRDIYPPIEDHAERKAFIRNKLALILGEENMDRSLLPSGHSGIDSVIANHCRQKATQDLLDEFTAYNAEQHRIVEEQQRRLAEEEASQLKVQVLLEHYRSRYTERVEKIASFGPQLNKAIDLLEIAMQNNSPNAIATIALAIVEQIIRPTYTILEAMDIEIPLEEVGAKGLQTEWPLERLDKVYTLLKNEPSLPQELIYLGQGIEVVVARILKPTPFKNPLDPKPKPVHAFYQAYKGGAASNSSMANVAVGNVGAPLAHTAASS